MMESVESETWALMTVKRTPESARLKKTNSVVRHTHTAVAAWKSLAVQQVFAGQFDQVPAHWSRVLKIVVYVVINSTQVRAVAI